MTGSYPIDYFIALLVLGIMLLGFVVVLRMVRLKGGGLWKRSWLGSKGGGLRLKIIEGSQIDPKRRLLLVGCDDVEYLLLLGGPNDLLIEKIEKNDASFSSQLSEVNADD